MLLCEKRTLFFLCLSLVRKFDCWRVQFVNVFCKNLLGSAVVLVREVGGNGKWRINGPLLCVRYSDIGVLMSRDWSLHIQHVKSVIDSAHLSAVHKAKTVRDKFPQPSHSSHLQRRCGRSLPAHSPGHSFSRPNSSRVLGSMEQNGIYTTCTRISFWLPLSLP